MKEFVFRVGDAVSQLLNVLIYWRNGSANLSISTDAYRQNRVRTMAVIDFIFSIYEDDHCKKSYLNDVARAQMLVSSHAAREADKA